MERVELKNKTIFITGVAGFIGANLAKRLFNDIEGIKIVGIDNMNDYYDVKLKEARLEELSSNKDFNFIKGNLADKAVVTSIFEQYKPNVVVNLGAQAGVRYSITNPDAYVEGNLIGLNFDRAWEGVMSDMQYSPEICRNIAVDIRYVLFIIDKYAGAQRLIDEMVIIR